MRTVMLDMLRKDPSPPSTTRIYMWIPLSSAHINHNVSTASRYDRHIKNDLIERIRHLVYIEGIASPGSIKQQLTTYTNNVLFEFEYVLFCISREWDYFCECRQLARYEN